MNKESALGYVKWAIPLALLLSLSCQNSASSDNGILVVVNVNGQPSDTQSLRVTTTLNNIGALNVEEFAGNVMRFGLQFKADASGALKLNIEALRADRCLTARGVGDAMLGGQPQIEITVTVMPLLPLECNGMPQPTLAVTKMGDSTGTVTSQPMGINCGQTCSAAYPAGTMVSLTAQFDPGTAQFGGWSGGCAGSDPNQCQVAVNGLVTVYATFNKIGTNPGPSAGCLDANWCWQRTHSPRSAARFLVVNSIPQSPP